MSLRGRTLATHLATVGANVVDTGIEHPQTRNQQQMDENLQIERDPSGKAASVPGAKMDAGKPPVVRGALQYFPYALKAVAELSAKGATKYSWRGWEHVPDGVNRYSEALGRHLLAEGTETLDRDTGLPHAYAVAWNALARLELMLRPESNT